MCFSPKFTTKMFAYAEAYSVPILLFGDIFWIIIFYDMLFWCVFGILRTASMPSLFRENVLDNDEFVTEISRVPNMQFFFLMWLKVQIYKFRKIDF